MTDIAITPQSLKTAKSIGSFVGEVYKKRQRSRAEEFFQFVELRYEAMMPEEQEKLNEYICSPEGQDILAEYAESIARTSSKRVRMAFALLYCQDPEFNFNSSEKLMFAHAMHGMRDELLDFFLDTMGLPVQTTDVPYPRAGIHHENFEKFLQKGWDEEAIFVSINDLIRLRLLLSDPKTTSVSMGNNTGWAIWFGVTERSRRVAALIRKADALLPKS